MRLVRTTGLVTALVGLAAVLVAPVPAAAMPAQRDSASITTTHILHLIRINCDDEAARFSDEISLFINGVWQDSKTNMDGGDWWDLFQPIQRLAFFDDSVNIEIREQAGWTIGASTIFASDAGLGNRVITYVGFHTTHYQYRFTYWVE